MATAATACALEISGAECVSALVLAGFRIEQKTKESTLLARGKHVVIVPDIFVLAPAVLEAILGKAHLSYAEFVELISEEPTLPDHATLPA